MFATTCLSHLKFGDYQSSAGPTDTSQVSDITMFNTTGPPRPPAVGELKSFRTVEIEDYSIREDYQLSGSVKVSCVISGWRTYGIGHAGLTSGCGSGRAGTK
ncbi:hypothetical protein N7516_004413 [Penicillium verrucosum]|uniref:uncharacterized protein n=1 Tax=Penicillium verrucosum TaxID=60171 RepID=UPI00254502DE|nr:uncharacterized protein N7516_004413 [Penicillium verrucosum]KAJ5944245.1 hypothetical protein N7516_004413 [Penicillium verrucosum]